MLLEIAPLKRVNQPLTFGEHFVLSVTGISCHEHNTNDATNERRYIQNRW